MANADKLDAAIIYDRDFEYDYFGFKTLEKSYLLKMHNKIVERPQHMLMRVSIGIHKADLDKAIETYHLMSDKWFTHATPTMFNASTPYPQMSSCFLLSMKEDSIDGIFETLKLCAQISKSAGGIGLAVQHPREGLVHQGLGRHLRRPHADAPRLRQHRAVRRPGRRQAEGAFAVYLEPWHADLPDFLDLKKNHGKEEARARSVLSALWIPDLFMKRVEANGEWSLFCPNECPGLVDSWGEKFEALYTKYESEGKARQTVQAQQLWFSILDSQIETGTPYILYKDSANRKSNQQNLGTIRCSNLCTEIIEYTSPEEVAVCSIASIALPRFVREGLFDLEKLHEITYTVTRNLNRVIDNNFYPVEEARLSNMKHRPIGLGVQGLADAFIHLRMPFDSEEARALNREIFETIYYAALCCSCDLARDEGHYETYQGSPVSKGVLQFDMWGVTPTSRWDWPPCARRSRSTASATAARRADADRVHRADPRQQRVLRAVHVEPLSRRVLAGEFAVNQHLLRDLMARGLWTDDIRNQIIAHNGSVTIPEIPDDLKALYHLLGDEDALAHRHGRRPRRVHRPVAVVHVFMTEPNYAKLSSMHFYGWKKGLKTGMYYLRTRAAADAIKFTVDQQKLSAKAKQDKSGAASSEAVDVSEPAPENNGPGECLSCGA